jgi:CheY-like chemotaxis protein
MQSTQINILIVEDNFADFYYLGELLRGFGKSPAYTFKHASSLADCAQCLKTATYDVIYLDLGLPGSDGLDTLTAAQRLAGDIPLIVVTGFEEPDTIKSARERGFEVLIKGDFDGDTLNNQLVSV